MLWMLDANYMYSARDLTPTELSGMKNEYYNFFLPTA